MRWAWVRPARSTHIRDDKQRALTSSIPIQLYIFKVLEEKHGSLEFLIAFTSEVEKRTFKKNTHTESINIRCHDSQPPTPHEKTKCLVTVWVLGAGSK